MPIRRAATGETGVPTRRPETKTAADQKPSPRRAAVSERGVSSFERCPEETPAKARGAAKATAAVTPRRVRAHE